jgi:hypothetical protein
MLRIVGGVGEFTFSFSLTRWERCSSVPNTTLALRSSAMTPAAGASARPMNEEGSAGFAAARFFPKPEDGAEFILALLRTPLLHGCCSLEGTITVTAGAGLPSTDDAWETLLARRLDDALPLPRRSGEYSIPCSTKKLGTPFPLTQASWTGNPDPALCDANVARNGRGGPRQLL